MFKNILVPLDGSQMAESVLPTVTFLAEIFNAKVILTHIIEKNAPTYIHGENHLKTSGQAQTYLEKIAARRIAPGIGVKYHVHTTEVKDVARSIVEHSGEFGYDLIIMCTHGHGGARNVIFGSLAQQVIALGTIPVLLIQPDKEEAGTFKPWRHLLVPLNEDPEHARSLTVATDLAKKFKASLYLVMVIPTFGSLSGQWISTSKFLPGTTTRLLDEAAANGQDYLLQYQNDLQNNGVEATIDVLRGDPADVISETALEAGVDLIILGTHGKIGTDAFWSGSLMPKICTHSKIPVLLVPVKITT